ncbi:glycerol-3-phosphate dehydrogenase [Mycolicibacterium litorale]|uniref:Glycerol-3-phosphate dehydrogenase n=2 Tax=Mycolicibacterium litorale TaxID=758802 RepID=A0A6S6P6U3_9MYCO|nr:glycerol-3-phosphate dehydrogenase [Mycolicibacterium litorale]
MATGELDVLVVGGGVVGAGTALDAVTRGLRVGLVEGRDYASGTSSRSSKLVHGGLRYLKQLDVPLVFEALRERSLILHTLAPHLARPVEFLYPLRRRFVDRAWVGLGVGVYDALGAGRGVPGHHRHLGKRRTMELFPGGRPDEVHGAVSFYEGQLDDARHTMTLARTAAGYGALCATSARVTGFLEESGRVVGAVVRDLETGGDVEVRAKRTIVAAGPWTEELQSLLGRQGPLQVHTSKGVHIVVPRAAIDAHTGIITETATSLLFVIPCPWSDEHWVIGTTDTSWNLDLAHPAASASDIDYILAQVNRLLATPVTRRDIVGVFAGLRPLLAGGTTQTSALSREHAVVSPADGLVLVTGGKYTTYRVMARDAVDAAFRGTRVDGSCTERLPLLGADGYHELWAARARLAGDTGLDVATVEHLLGRYGSAVTEIVALIAADPALAERVSPHRRYLRAEVVYAVTHEGALHLDDILTRRTRLSIETPDRGVEVAQQVAELVAPLLDWDGLRLRREVARYLARVQAELSAQRQPDDEAADAARLVAADLRDMVEI